jgi:tRNA(fMet)-specific endonuclease VapC
LKYVLDTNVMSEIMRGREQVLVRLERAGRQNILVPQPVLSELAYGIARLPRSARKNDLATMYARILEEFERCPWTDDVSERFGHVKASLERLGERLEDLDIAIASHALAHGATLVTSNGDHMRRVHGLRVEDWASKR